MVSVIRDYNKGMKYTLIDDDLSDNAHMSFESEEFKVGEWRSVESSTAATQKDGRQRECAGPARGLRAGGAALRRFPHESLAFGVVLVI